MEKVLLTIENNIAIVTINNEKALNAVDVEILKRLTEAFMKIDENPEVMVAILTAAGEKAFVAGADVNTFLTSTTEDVRQMAKLGQTACNAIAYCGVPVIGAVNGVALGGGLEIVLSCDIRLAAANAKFGQLEVLWGIMPAWGGTQRLPVAIGQSEAMRLMLTGETIDAQEAYRLGFLSGVYPVNELMKQALELAQKIVSIGGVQTRYIKRAASHGGNKITKAALTLESELLQNCFRTGEPKKRVEKYLSNQNRSNKAKGGS